MGLTQPCTEPWDGPPEDGPQLLDGERGRLFALKVVWDDGVEGTRVSSSHRSDVQLQQEWERLLDRLNRENGSVSFYYRY